MSVEPPPSGDKEGSETNPYAFGVGQSYPDLTPAPPKLLPYSKWIPLIAGVLTGIALRLVYSGKPGGPYAAMTGSFVYLAPLLVGAVTVYVAETRQRRSWIYYIWAPFVANVLFVLGTLVIMIEGLICAVLIVPLFSALGSVGGLIMGLICRKTNWPKPALYTLVAAALVSGYFEDRLPLPERTATVERSILIRAPPEVIWQQIMQPREIRPAEVDRAWIYRIGAPVPLSAATQQAPEGMVRKMTMGKGVHFDQVVTQWQVNRYVHWNYRFYADSFPPDALDDHVMVGGRYFDLKDTSYTLTPNGDATALTIRMSYRLSTRFNWYAAPLARRLFDDLEQAILELYRQRCEIRVE